jgi:hypothetical protein
MTDPKREANQTELEPDDLAPGAKSMPDWTPEQAPAEMPEQTAHANLEPILDGNRVEPAEPIEESVTTGPQGETVTGRLSYENRIADVLRRLIKVKSKADAILRLRSPNGTVDGSILITNRRFITGATCEHGQVVGYAAVRKLLMLTAGDYSWSLLKVGDLCPIERNLNINLKALIPKLPFLPETLSDFFDEPSLLDKIFHPKRWADLRDDPSLLDWVFSPHTPGPAEPEKTIRESMPQLSRTWTTLEPIPLVKEERDQPIKVPRHLREGVLRGESLAHTVTRNFGTVGSVAYANARRLQRKKTTFNASRASGPFLPLPTLFIGLGVILLASIFWVSTTSHHADVATKKKAVAKNERPLTRHQKSH